METRLRDDARPRRLHVRLGRRPVLLDHEQVVQLHRDPVADGLESLGQQEVLDVVRLLVRRPRLRRRSSLGGSPKSSARQDSSNIQKNGKKEITLYLLDICRLKNQDMLFRLLLNMEAQVHQLQHL